MNWLASLFGGGKTTDKIVDGVIDGVDAMFFTDEEKSVANQKVLDFKLEWMKATQGQNIARRIIAVGVTAMWLLAGLIILGAQAFGHVEFSKFAFTYLKDVVSTPFAIIIGFYFAAHIMGKLK